MTLVPRYDIAPGTEVEMQGAKLVLAEQAKDGYVFWAPDTGQSRFVSVQQFADTLKLPGIKIGNSRPETGTRLQVRMGGVASSKALPQVQQDNAKFNLALCIAMQHLRDTIRLQTNDPGYEFSINKLNDPVNRKFIKDHAERIFGQKIRNGSGIGGRTSTWTLYQGRTLIKYFAMFENVGPGESPLDALVTLEHQRGNRVPRIGGRVKELMTLAWVDVGLDAKGSSVAEVSRQFEELRLTENERRIRNELDPLPTVSASTLSAHRREMMTPLDFMIATKGQNYARNKRGRGSTTIRALLVGEYVEIDECKASLVIAAKSRGSWETLTEEERKALKSIDKVIGQRLMILVMIDVATRMPLAWIISDQARHEATLALFRMATRDKTRERTIYGCTGTPVQAVGLGNVKMDNGTGLRNATTIGALLGSDAMATISRTHVGMDKPYVERMFGTIESRLLKSIHGYTGRKPGELPNYDAMVNGVLSIDELSGILTRFMIDEYPSTPHSGVGMHGRRPYEVYQEINASHGHMLPQDPNLRRIHLGWEFLVTPSDEGVMVLSGIWYNSERLQQELDTWRMERSSQASRRVRVFIDPDNVNHATVLLPEVKDPVEVDLQMTAFADMTVPEILELMAAVRKEDPGVTEMHEDRVRRVRRERREQLKAIGVERNLPRSFSTLDECSNKARALLRGARLVPTGQLSGTRPAGSVVSLESSVDVIQLGTGNDIIDGTAVAISPTEVQSGPGEPAPLSAKPQPPQEPTSPEAPSRPRKKRSPETEPVTLRLGRPKNLKKLE